MDEEAAVVGEDVDAKLLADDLVDVVDRLEQAGTVERAFVDGEQAAVWKTNPIKTKSKYTSIF